MNSIFVPASALVQALSTVQKDIAVAHLQIIDVEVERVCIRPFHHILFRNSTHHDMMLRVRSGKYGCTQIIIPHLEYSFS